MEGVRGEGLGNGRCERGGAGKWEGRMKERGGAGKWKV